MRGLKHTVVATLLACSIGCDQSPGLHSDEQEQDATDANHPSSHADLNRAVAWRANQFAGGDMDRTVAYYRENPSDWHSLVDLNGDGVEEAIATTTFTVDESGKLDNVDGVTGNRPFCVFHQRDGKWTPLMEEDFWCRDYSIEKTTVNGWAVLSSMSRLNIAAYPVDVYAYEDGGYRIIYEHTVRPWEEQSESR